ncbi:MAG: hypothetical protein RL033_172 [Pseudomonadota bacterium]|jgi:hypothetical protein
MPIPLERILRVVAWTAAAVVLAMLGIFLVTGVGQEPLQYVQPSATYAQLLLRNPPVLRAVLALDDTFIVLYGVLFICQAVVLPQRGANRALTLTSSALLGAVALLDMIENFHFLALLGQAEQGIWPSDAAISAQVVESLLKFHVSYLGLFLLGLALPRRRASERWLGWLSCYLQLPVGMLVHVTPPVIAVPLVLLRLAYFVTALCLLGWAFGSTERRPDAKPLAGAVGSGAPA